MKGDFIQTYTGNKFWPFDPKPEHVNIYDIAHSLSLLCRYNGHCKKLYSVAEHSILVARSLPKEFKLWGLMHDAAEAYFSDIPTPIKKSLSSIDAIESNIMHAICRAFDMPLEIPKEVEKADHAILVDEKEQVMDKQIHWNSLDLIKKPLGAKIDFLSPGNAESLFLTLFKIYNIKEQ